MQPKNAFALFPLLVFLILFIGTGSYLTSIGTSMAFYQLSAAVAIIPAVVFALMQGQGRINQRIAVFLKGVGEINIITMCMIYLLAGAFASVAGAIGGVTATVNFGLSLVPASFILPGLFVIGAFISTAMGTSMGTIAAIAPIALGISDQTDISLPLLLGVVVSGAMFGDNLSMISDTTIAASRTQGCEMKDKFIMNFWIALPAALVALVLFYAAGATGAVLETQDYQFLKVLPYIAILAMAIAGVNVFVVLLSGIILSGAVGISTVDNYTLLSFSGDIYKGFAGMNEIMILSMMLGGLGELIKQNGGISWLLEKVDNFAKRHTAQAGENISEENAQKCTVAKKRTVGEWSIAFLVAFADFCVANNTVAIILTGGVSKEIAVKNDIDPRRSASILDMVSCVFQGLLPYAAQLLLAGSIAQLSPIDIAFNNWYCMLLGVAVIIAITFGIPKMARKVPVA